MGPTKSYDKANEKNASAKPLPNKRQRVLVSPRFESSSDAPQAEVDNVEPTLTASEPPAEEVGAVVEESGCSPEILKIPTSHP
jgi:hypothetical protein